MLVRMVSVEVGVPTATRNQAKNYSQCLLNFFKKILIKSWFETLHTIRVNIENSPRANGLWGKEFWEKLAISFHNSGYGGTYYVVEFRSRRTRKHQVFPTFFTSAPPNKFSSDRGLYLGPLLIILFADDTVLYLSANSMHELTIKINQELENVDNWLKYNKSSLNYSKTQYMLFTKQKKCRHKFQCSN